MSEVLALEHLALAGTGSTLTMSVSRGESVAITGTAGSGKTALMRQLSGVDKPSQGKVRRVGKVVIAESGGLPKRAKVQSVATDRSTANLGSEALTALGLWDHRQKPVSSLSAAQVAAAELLEALAADAGLVFIDELLDRLDPWALHAVLTLMRGRTATSYVVATVRPDIVCRMDMLVVLRDMQVRFAGTCEELIRKKGAHRLTVSTGKHDGVKALVEPFQVQVQQREEGFEFTAPEGQEIAARLLLEGYGDVQFVIDRLPTLEEALLSL